MIASLGSFERPSRRREPDKAREWGALSTDFHVYFNPWVSGWHEIQVHSIVKAKSIGHWEGEA